MSQAAFLPPVPAPPHDPYSLRLDRRAGFRDGALDAVEIAPDGTLALEPLPGAGRQLAESTGSLGGLVPPSVVALDGAGVYLLDRARGLLLAFDRCACRFVPSPCPGGIGSGPRQLQDPRGIGIACGNLFICDALNHRLQVYMLRGLVLRGYWKAPDASWEPVDVAFDRRGSVFVADRANGAVQVFSPQGRWLRSIDGVGSVRHLAIDAGQRLYVVLDGDPEVRVLDLDGTELERVSRADVAADRFPRLPFKVLADGALGLGATCLPPHPELYFDLQGQPFEPGPQPPPKLYPKHGSYLSEALDSRLYQCTWDRLALRVSLPPQCGLQVKSYTAETNQPLGLIAALPDEAWETNRTVRPSADSPFDWDCLLMSARGRFLWLRLEMTGDGTASPRVRTAVVDFPRVSLARYLPAVFRGEPVSADFTDRFLEVFDRGFREIEKQIDWQARLFDPLSAPAGDARRGGSDFLGWLAGWLGVTLTAQWPVARRRRYLKKVARLFCMRGTRTGLRRQLLLFLGVDERRCHPRWQAPPLLLEHFQARRWLFVGEGRLGEHARLWGKRIVRRSELDENAELGATRLDTSKDPLRDPFHVYAHRFTAFLPARLARSEGEQRAVRQLIELERPAHAAFDIEWVKPRMRIGIQSMIGYDAVIGGYPAGGLVVDEAELGRGTVVGRSPLAGPTLRVGHDARVGTTTKLG